jgi:hypothetical protein
MNPTAAALVAALQDAIRFAENAWGPNTALADRTTAPWRAAIAAVTAPEESADPRPAVKYHLDQAVDLVGAGWRHTLAIGDLTGADVGDVLRSVQVLTSSGALAACNLPDDQVQALIAAWRATDCRRRSAKGLP